MCGLRDCPLRHFLNAGIVTTVNSHDPAYFFAYETDNWRFCMDALDLSRAELVQLAKNGICASFMPETAKQEWLAKIGF